MRLIESTKYIFPDSLGQSIDLSNGDVYVNHHSLEEICYDIKPVRTKEGKSYWKIPLGDDDATRGK